MLCAGTKKELEKTKTNVNNLSVQLNGRAYLIVVLENNFIRNFFQVTQFKIIFIIAIYNLINIPFDCVFINIETKKELVKTRADLTKHLDGLISKSKGILPFLY